MPAPYYLIVEGQRGPKRPHASAESAQDEAERLYQKFRATRTVRVLETAVELIGVPVPDEELFSMVGSEFFQHTPTPTEFELDQNFQKIFENRPVLHLKKSRKEAP